MPFSWMEEKSDPAPKSSAEGSKEATETELKERAALMRRLGYSKADALHRCLGNLAWAYSVAGTPDLSPARVRKLVGEVYAGAS